MVPDGDLGLRIARALDGRREILEAYLFGSRARGDARVSSDIDVAIYVEPAAKIVTSFGIDADVAADLMVALGTSAVDVVVLNRAPPLLYHRVLRDGTRVLSRDLKATTRRETMAMSRYFDYLPHLAKIKAAADRRFAAGNFGR